MNEEYIKATITPGKSREEEVYGMHSSEESKCLASFVRRFHKKTLLISVKPIATWINSNYSRELHEKYVQFLSANKITVGDETTDVKINGVNPGDNIFYNGLTEPDRIRMDFILFYEAQLQHNGRPWNNYRSIGQGNDGLLTTMGRTAVFGPNNFNALVPFWFAGKEITMPLFYSAPHEVITSLSEILPDTSGTKYSLYKAKVGKSKKANLAIVKETKDNLEVNILSLAGLVFAREIILSHLKAKEEEWQEALRNRAAEKMAELILTTTRRELTGIRADIEKSVTYLSELYRQEFSLNSKIKNTNPADVLKKVVEQIQAQAKNFAFVKRVVLEPNGLFEAILGPLTLTAFQDRISDEFTSRIPRTQEEEDIVMKRIDVPLGYIKVRLGNGSPKVWHIGGGVLRHPHVFDDAKMCLGSGGSIYSELLGKVDIIQAFRFVFATLMRYNPDSPARSMYSIEDFGFAKPVEKLPELGIGEILIYEIGKEQNGITL